MADLRSAPNASRFEVRATASDHFAWVRTRLALEPTITAWLRTAVALDDGEAESDQRDRGAQPRHYRAFEGQAGADPGKMIRHGCPDFESACSWGGV